MPETNPSFWLSAAQWLVTIGLAVVVWLRKPGEDATLAVGALREKFVADFARLSDQLSNEVADLRTAHERMEERIKHVPSLEQLAKLEGMVRVVETQNEGIRDGMAVMRTQLNRIEDFLKRHQP